MGGANIEKAKPGDLKQYEDWLIIEKGFSREILSKETYNKAAQVMKQQFEESDLWSKLKEEFREIDARYTFTKF